MPAGPDMLHITIGDEQSSEMQIRIVCTFGEHGSEPCPSTHKSGCPNSHTPVLSHVRREPATHQANSQKLSTTHRCVPAEVLSGSDIDAHYTTLTHRHTCTYTHTHVRMCTQPDRHTHMCMYTYIYIYIRVESENHTHAHIHI